MRAFLFGILFTLIVGGAAFYALLRTGSIPASADGSNPSPLEKFVARTSLRATLQNEAPQEPNPVALTDANLTEGIKLYGQNCAACHGVAEHGVAEQKGSAPPIAKGENPAPPQLAQDGVEDDPEGWTFWKIKHGIRWTGMPAWGDVLNDQQIWTLALFLKHMDKLPPGPQQAWQALTQPTGAAAAQAGQAGQTDQGGTVGQGH